MRVRTATPSAESVDNLASLAAENIARDLIECSVTIQAKSLVAQVNAKTGAIRIADSGKRRLAMLEGEVNGVVRPLLPVLAIVAGEIIKP